MTDSERITKLETQITSLQAALSLVLSAEHRAVLHGAGVPEHWKEEVIQDLRVRWNIPYSVYDYDIGQAIRWAEEVRKVV
ncbi:MAG: hypothetical protein KAV87_10635 [Desulfobacteraceae bacterium]|nr:hypothetical protein [Desulfobacteraceae bacterium]